MASFRHSSASPSRCWLRPCSAATFVPTLSTTRWPLALPVSPATYNGRTRPSPLRSDAVVFLDCPPSLGLLTVNALAAADEVIIPIQCEYYALEGLVLLLRTIEKIKVYLNSELRIGGILLTMHDARTNISRQVMEEVRRQYPRETFQTVIPRNVRLSEAPSYGKPIAEYDPHSRGAEAYHELAKEVIAHD